MDLFDSLDSDKVQDGFKHLNLDFDFGPMIRQAQEKTLETLNFEIERKISERDRVQNLLNNI